MPFSSLFFKYFLEKHTTLQNILRVEFAPQNFRLPKFKSSPLVFVPRTVNGHGTDKNVYEWSRVAIKTRKLLLSSDLATSTFI